MVGIAEAFALLFLGLVAGITSTIFDIVVFGQASFMGHFALWALFNALVAIHVDSRLKAFWWAIPFNLGYIECYYICTAFSYEGYPKSSLVILAGLALVSPFLTYPFWTAKRDNGPYGKILSFIIVGAVVATSYYLYQGYDMYSIVVSAVLLFVLLFWPARRLKFVPAPHPVTTGESVEKPVVEPTERPRSFTRRRLSSLPRVDAEERRSSRRSSSSQSRLDDWSQVERERADVLPREYPETITRSRTTSRSSSSSNRNRSSRPTRRTAVSSRPSTRRNRQRRYERDREIYRSDATRRRERRTRGVRSSRYDMDYSGSDSSSRRSRTRRSTRRMR